MKNKYGYITGVEIGLILAIVLLLSAVLIPAVMKAKENAKIAKRAIREKDHNGVEYTIIKIDGCEYIDNLNGHGSHIYTHKGNCKNHIRSSD